MFVLAKLAYRMDEGKMEELGEFKLDLLYGSIYKTRIMPKY